MRSGIKKVTVLFEHGANVKLDRFTWTIKSWRGEKRVTIRLTGRRKAVPRKTRGSKV